MAVSLVALLVLGGVVGGVVCLGIAVVAWYHRAVPAALPFGGMMLGVAAWAFADASFLIAPTTDAAYVADVVIRTAGAQVPALWVLFVLAFAGYEQWVNWRTVAILWLVPLLYSFVSVTAPILGLASTPADVVFLTSNGIRAPFVETTVAHDFNLLYSYLAMTIGYAILVSFLLRSRAVYRKQTGIIVLGSVAPVVVYTALNLGLTPHPGIDMTPIAFAASGLVFGVALVRYDFLSVTPMAGDVLVDEDERIIDHNPAAAATFDLDGRNRDPIEAIDPAMSPSLGDGDRVRLEESRRDDDRHATYFQASVARIEDQYGNERNELVVLRDVTGQQRRQERLEALQEATRQFLTASTDEQIAEISVEYADEVLETDGTAIFLTERGADGLRTAATTETLADVFDRDEGPDEPIATMLATALETNEPVTQELPGEVGGPPERAHAAPLGDHGVLWIGTGDADVFAADDEGFATILARTTQVALTRVERESALRQSRSSVERRSEQIAFFNGVLRHTLRNALLVIQGRAEHLRDQIPDEEQPHIDTVVDWCDDLAALSEEIRAVNDTVIATESERLDDVDLTGMLLGCVRTFERDHEGVSFETDVDDGLQVQANELATRVIDSVLENAVIHNDREDPHIEVWTVRAADRVQVHVADDGPGMDDEMKSTVFERDLTTSETASGFGLYFVSVLMNLYGGTVWFEDNHPRGTVAVLEFQATDDTVDGEMDDSGAQEVDSKTD